MKEETIKGQEETSQVFLCSGCGGNMEFDVSVQRLKCPYCGTEMDIRSEETIKEYDFDDVVELEKESEWNAEVNVVKCDACGAETVIGKDETAVHCSYCGSSHVLESKQSAGIKPEAILPFKVDKHEAKELFQKWIARKWLAPGHLKHLYQSEKLISVYIPYWTYDSNVFATYTAQGGKHYYQTVVRGGKRTRVRKTRWYTVRGRISKFFDDVLVNASKNYDDNLMNKIEPFDTKELEPYKPQYISGHTAERYSRGVVEGFNFAKEKMETILKEDVKKQVLRHYNDVRNIMLKARYTDVKYKHVLLPVWTSQYEFNNKKYRYMINGQTGKVCGKSPVSWAKIGIIAGVAVAAVLAFIFLTGDASTSSQTAMAYHQWIGSIV